MKKRKIAFDLDDTLIPNSYKYNLAIWKCGLIVSEALLWRCPYATELMKQHYDDDVALIKTYKFRADRFPTMWSRLYERLCQEAGVPVDPEVTKRLYAAAAEFQNGPFLPFPGVAEMLSGLGRDGHELHLITAGDHDLQWKKIREGGFERLFDELHVTDMEKKQILAEIVGDRPGDGVMVGDSKKSDIAPAVALGMNAVWVPSLTWKFVDFKLDPSSYHKLDSILDLPDFLRRLDESN